MVRLLLTTLAVAACCCCLSAQRFRCIDAGNDRFFINKDNYIRAIRPDSVTIDNGDTVLWHFKTIYADYSVWPCNADPFYPSWPGIKTVMRDSVQQFFTIGGDTIHFFTDGTLSWRFCNLPGGDYFNAGLNTIQVESVLGIPDSVFSFTINYFDFAGNPAPHIFNNKEIKISKSFGFTKTFNLNQFPEDTTVYFITDAKRYYRKDIYGYNAGDEFHWKIDPSNYPDFEYNDSVILVDSVSPSQINFTIQRVRHYCNYFNPPVVTYAIDTVIITEILYDPDSLMFPGLPGQTFFDSDTMFFYAYGMVKSIYSCGRVAIGYNTMPVVSYDSFTQCYSTSFEPITNNYTWFPSIGDRILSHYDPTALPPLSYSYRLDWYNTNGFQCGTPNYISVGENESNPSFILYPNPADESITVNFNSLFPVAGYTITDACGRKVMEENFIESGNNIEISSLDNGMYFFSIRFGERSSVKKFLVYR
ncbi:MAG: T9SS type A sorting domain-containing protein [Bacteroidota bacterium]